MIPENEKKLIISFFGQDFDKTPIKEAIDSWWQWVEGLASALMMAFTHIDVKFKYKPKGLKDQIPYDIGKYKKRIEAQLTNDNILTLSLNALPNPKDYVAFDWDLTSSCGFDERFGSLVLLGVDINRLSGWDKDMVVNFLSKCYAKAQQYMDVGYGFATIMPKKAFPLGYAIGIMSKVGDERLIYDATMWRRSARKNCRKVIRNLFGWSVLTSDHLQINIGSDTLAHWIEQNPNRGRLIQADESHFFWSFQNTSENIKFLEWDFIALSTLRTEMEKHCIFPWQQL